MGIDPTKYAPPFPAGRWSWFCWALGCLWRGLPKPETLCHAESVIVARGHEQRAKLTVLQARLEDAEFAAKVLEGGLGGLRAENADLEEKVRDLKSRLGDQRKLEEEVRELETRIRMRDADALVHEREVETLTKVIERDRLRVQAEAAGFASAEALADRVARRQPGD